VSDITHAAILPHCHSKFQVREGVPEAIELELIEVSPLKTSRRQEVFSLQFRGPPTIVLNQQIHRLEHAALGLLDIFLVPIGQDAQGVYYEAVFNRLIPAT
jgi:hypothetical protein